MPFGEIKGKNVIRRDQRKKYHSARSKEKMSFGEIKGKNVIRRDQRKKCHSARSKEKMSFGEIKGKNSPNDIFSYDLAE
jgi:hypothetical protein